MSVAHPQRLSYLPLPLHPGGRWWQRARLQLLARWHAGELDRQLAAGATPGATELLAVRGRWLTSRRCRTRVAAGLAHAVKDAQATAPVFSAAIRPDRREVIAARTLFATLAWRLRAEQPVSARGVALLATLLTDADSPLYQPTEPGALGSTLRAAAAALDPQPSDDRVRLAQESLR